MLKNIGLQTSQVLLWLMWCSTLIFLFCISDAVQLQAGVKNEIPSAVHRADFFWRFFFVSGSMKLPRRTMWSITPVVPRRTLWKSLRLVFSCPVQYMHRYACNSRSVGAGSPGNRERSRTACWHITVLGVVNSSDLSWKEKGGEDS